MITSVPGSSDIFECSFITYSNNSKRKFENLLTTKEQILKYLEDLNYDKVNQVNDNFIFFHKSFKN